MSSPNFYCFQFHLNWLINDDDDDDVDDDALVATPFLNPLSLSRQGSAGCTFTNTIYGPNANPMIQVLHAQAKFHCAYFSRISTLAAGLAEGFSLL